MVRVWAWMHPLCERGDAAQEDVVELQVPVGGSARRRPRGRGGTPTQARRRRPQVPVPPRRLPDAAPTLTSGYAYDLEQRPEPQLHPLGPGELRQQPPLPAGLRIPLGGRHRQRRRLGRNRRVQLVLLRPEAAGGQREQRHDLRGAPGHQQRLGQFRRSGRDLRRRPGPADRDGPVRRHGAAVRRGLQLRRGDDVRPGLLPCDGLPRGRGLLRREPQRLQRRHSTHRVHGAPRHQ